MTTTDPGDIHLSNYPTRAMYHTICDALCISLVHINHRDHND